MGYATQNLAGLTEKHSPLARRALALAKAMDELIGRRREPDMMVFAVGPWRYCVGISAEPLFDEEGSPAAGLFVWQRGLLLISSAISINARAGVLIHELRHAWVMAFGMPRDDEADANSAASFTLDFYRQFLRQGGEDALLAMKPLNFSSNP